MNSRRLVGGCRSAEEIPLGYNTYQRNSHNNDENVGDQLELLINSTHILGSEIVEVRVQATSRKLHLGNLEVKLKLIRVETERNSYKLATQ